jgi:predicted phosphodiesterase
MKVIQIILSVMLPIFAFGAADSYRLSWRSDPATSMVIGWNQASGSEPELCYDTQDHDRKVIDYQFRQAPDRVEDYRGMTNCFVRLENLQPDTAYYFVICDSDGVGRRLWFRTAPAASQPFTFIAGGDSRTNPEPRKKGNQLVAKLRPLFVLFGGDYTGSGTPAQWAEWFNDWQLTISEDGRIYPIIATHGNHENADLQMMDKLFDTPHIDQYYSFGFADELMRIWVLNTELEYKAPDLVAAQQAWLESDLPKHPDTKWKLASYHRPMRPHTTTKAEGLKRIAAWAQLFYDQGVDLVVESDTHMVKRTYPLRPSDEVGSYESFVREDKNGVTFIGEGSWGAPMKPSDDDKPWTMACDSFYQFKWIQVHPDEMLIRTVKFEDVEQVEALSEANLFDEPKRMQFWEPETGKVLRLPFDAKHASYTAPAKPSTLLELGQSWAWSLDGESWAEGPAPLGYGDAHVRTTIAAANDKPRCAFFKTTFSIDDPAGLSQVFFDLLVDDGCIIKLNGHEVIRYNMADGDITDQSFAIQGVVGVKETQVLPLPVDLKWLKRGVNTIEARVHQNTPHSSDLAFDLSVRVKRAVEHSVAPTRVGYEFGAIADCQYCDIQSTGLRRYALSKEKLANCVTDFNTMDLAFVTHLGDFIDRDFASFDVVNPIFAKLKAPKVHVLGNHDFSVADHLKKDVPAKLGMPSKYYDFEEGGWRYVILDGNDVSFHAYPEGSAEAQAAADYYENNQIKSPQWNGAIGAPQLAWLKTVLEKAQGNKEAVILFCHFPVYPQNAHNLWNADEVMALLESYSCVKAYINGHNHHGNYGKKGGIHYVTLKGMVDTETNSYAVIRVDDERIDITGYGREENRSLPISRP